MDLSYIITPFLAWFIAGCAKFTINSLKTGRFAFDLIGYGGLPSNHSSIVSSVVAIIAFKEGLQEPALVIALALALIVMLDANSLRRQVGRQAAAINKLNRTANDSPANGAPVLRERIGHTGVEIFAGIFTGIVSAWLANTFFMMFK